MAFGAVARLALLAGASAQLNMAVWPSTAFNPPSAATNSTIPAVDLSSFVGDYTSVRLFGTINTAVPELIAFTLVHDGGVRLWIDDHLTIE